MKNVFSLFLPFSRSQLNVFLVLFSLPLHLKEFSLFLGLELKVLLLLLGSQWLFFSYFFFFFWAMTKDCAAAEKVQ